MLKKLMQTDDDTGRFLVRLFLGIVMFPHGAQKLLGWFGGGGFSGTMQGMTGMGLPAFIVFLVIIAEFFGALSLIFGFLGRLGALAILCVMLGAIFTVHLQNGFFMNWMGSRPGKASNTTSSPSPWRSRCSSEAAAASRSTARCRTRGAVCDEVRPTAPGA